MKKNLILFLISSISICANVETEIKFGVNSAFGVEGVNYPSAQLGAILKTALPRKTEAVEYVSERQEISESDKDKKVVKSQKEKNIYLSKKYVSRGVQIDRTLDMTVNLKDYNTKLQASIKSTPYRIGQNFHFFDINRAKLSLNSDYKGFFTDTKYYITGYENGTPGFNRYFEGEKVEKTYDKTLDTDTRFKFLGLKYYGDFKNQKITPYVYINPINNDTHKIAFKAGFSESNLDDNYFMDLTSAKGLAPGVDKIEYFKNWELAENRDLKLANLDGKYGSIRAVGFKSGALYGNSLVKAALPDVAEELYSQITYGDTIKSIVKDKNLLSALSLAFKDTSKLKEDFVKIKDNIDGRQDQLIIPIVERLVITTKMMKKDPVSDFYITHYLPKEYRKYLKYEYPKYPYNENDIDYDIVDVVVRRPETTTGISTDTSIDSDLHDSINNTELKPLIDLARNSKNVWELLPEIVKAGDHIDVLHDVVYNPDKLRLFDLFKALQINYSEYEYMQNEFYNQLFSSDFKGDKKSEFKYKTNGYMFGFEYLNKKFPLRISLDYENEKYKKDTVYSSNYEEKKSDYLEKIAKKYEKIKGFGISDSYTHSIEGEKKVSEQENRDKFNAKIEYLGENLNAFASLDLLKKNKIYSEDISKNVNTRHEKNKLFKKEKEDIKFTLNKQSYVDYDEYDINLGLGLSYAKRFNKFTIVPKIEYNGAFLYVSPNNIYATNEYEKEEDKEQKAPSVMVYKRAENGHLIKSENAPITGVKEFDDIKPNEKVDISKFSKYLFEDGKEYFTKEEKGATERLMSSYHVIIPGLDVYYNIKNNITLGYHVITPIAITNRSIDGVLIKNSLSLSVKF